MYRSEITTFSNFHDTPDQTCSNGDIVTQSSNQSINWRTGGIYRFTVPPKSCANFAGVQHSIHHLAPHGMAGCVLANGSMSSNKSGEGDIRCAVHRNHWHN